MLIAWHSFLVGLVFIPHGHCYLWKPGLVGLHLTSDLLIAIAYYSIPLTLLYFARKRSDLPFDWVFQLFSAFIIACGTSHLMEIWTLWHPTYWLAGVLKAITAIVSIYTAIALVFLVPQALALPSPAQLEAANRELEREIQERVKVEENLRQSEARYRAMVEDQTELICRFAPDCTFTFVNDAYCRYFGKNREELLGKTWLPVIYQDDLEKVQNQLASLSPDNPVVTIINRAIRPDGKVCIHQWINRMIFNQQGNCIEIQAVGRDITEFKETETALKESQRFIEKITDAAPVILYVYDLLKQQNIYINQEVTKLLGYTVEEVQQMGNSVLATLLHPEDLASLPEGNQRWEKAQDSDVFRLEYRMKHRNGEWRYFLSQETLFARTETGIPQQVLGAAVDITDRKLFQQLQLALKEKEVLLQEIHHRVKNNLQIIYSLLRLQRRKLQDQKISEVLLDSQNRIKSIALIHEKLYRSTNWSEINLNQYISSLVTGLVSAYQVSSEQITLQVQVADVILDIDTAIPCGLIINELVSNSLKYAFPNQKMGQITISVAWTETTDIALTISDNGVGIPEQFDLATAPSLGLKLVKDLVGQLEGTLEIDRHQGTTFRIFFPGRNLC